MKTSNFIAGHELFPKHQREKSLSTIEQLASSVRIASAICACVRHRADIGSSLDGGAKIATPLTGRMAWVHDACCRPDRGSFRAAARLEQHWPEKTRPRVIIQVALHRSGLED